MRRVLLCLLWALPFTGFSQAVDTMRLGVQKAFSVKAEKVSVEQISAARLNGLSLPTACIIYGFTSRSTVPLCKLDKSTHAEITENHHGQMTSIDNYLQYLPAVAVYGLNAVGIKGRHTLRDRTGILVLSTAMSGSVVSSLKKVWPVTRPDGSSCNSFPSGHTATAFANAEFMRQEFKDVSPWYGIGAYGVATATGILRMYNNKHWLSDVVAGAGIGIISNKLAAWLYPKISKKLFHSAGGKAVLTPQWQQGGAGVLMVYNFHE